MRAALVAGAAYAAVAFAAGFVLGTLRVLVVAPRLGELGAVALEVPVMLAVSWLACARLERRFAVPRAAGARLAMGATGFVLLQAAEVALGGVAFGRGPAEQLDALAHAPGAIGLVAQLAFAAIPIVRLARRERGRGAAMIDGRDRGARPPRARRRDETTRRRRL